MLLSIITINYNDAQGLRRTMQSVFSQTETDFEYIVVDGASSDDSISVIEEFAALNQRNLKWISEKDTGIYNAMNKGIQMATGDYLEFLNSGDTLYNDDVVKNMFAYLNNINSDRNEKNLSPISVITGNMYIQKDGKKVVWKGPKTDQLSFTTLYLGSVNHSTSYIKRELFMKYGLYDETLRIVSDWKFFFETLVMNNEPIEFVDMTVTKFDLSGISSTNLKLREQERNQVLQDLFPPLLYTQLKEMYPYYMKAKRLMKSPFMSFILTTLYRILCKFDKCYYSIKNK